MLNIDLIDELYESLSKEEQQNLIVLLFKRSKQTMNYFRRTKDISLSKLEILADYFHKPLDYFRAENCGSKSTNILNDLDSSLNNHTDILLENKYLRKDLKRLEEALKDKEELINVSRKYIRVLEDNFGIPEQKGMADIG